MQLTCDEAQAADAPRIAELYMTAFGTNGMLLAQLPNEQCRRGFVKSIERKIVEDARDPKITVLVVRSGESTSAGKVVAFSTWAHPIRPDESYTESPWSWPAGTDMKMIESWANVIARGQEKALGTRPCFRLNFIATDPQFGKQGAASMMMQWGLNISRKQRVPIYLESTMEAINFYRRKGFRLIEELSLELCPTSDPGQGKTYSEFAFLLEFRADSFGHEDGISQKLRCELESDQTIVIDDIDA